MAYARFFDSDLYLYPHVDGYIECCACWLNAPLEGGFGLSEKIYDDEALHAHLALHKAAGHKMPKHLERDILRDKTRYERM